MFELVKWYMDVVAEDGSAVVAYSAKRRWGAARVSVGSYCHRNIAGVLRGDRVLDHGWSLYEELA